MMMIAALYDNNFQQGRTTPPPPPEQFNQPGPSGGQVERYEMEEFVMNERQKITAAATFQDPHIYDEAGFQEIELLATNEEPLYQNENNEF